MRRMILFLVASVICMGSVTRVSAQCNTIDAVTTASFRITGGQACSTSASLTWNFKENNGELRVEWGTSTSYGTSKSLYPSSPVQLPDLSPNTTYFYHVWGVYRNRTYQYTKSSFKTSGTVAPANKPPVITTAAAVACTTGKELVYTVAATDEDGDQITFSVSGQPSWITFASPALTIKPVTGSTNTTVKIIATDGKGGADTLDLAVTVKQITAVRSVHPGSAEKYTLLIGQNRFVVPASNASPLAVSLFTVGGAQLFRRSVPLHSKYVQLSCDGIPEGMYVLQIHGSEVSTIRTVHISRK